MTYNGSYTLEGTGDPDPDGSGEFNGTETLNQLSLSGANVAEPITINARFNFGWTTSNAIRTMTEALSYTGTMGSRSTSVTNYRLSSTTNLSTGEIRRTQSYIITSSVIPGTLKYSTPQELVGLSTEPYPRMGQMLLTGVSNSKLRLTIQGSGQPDGVVLVELDANGDDVYESSENYTWAELDTI